MSDYVRDLSPRSIAVVFGTRPEVIKLAHIIELLGDAARLIHTGQHYDERLSKVFLDTFDLPQPELHLDVGGQDRGTQIGEALTLLSREFTSDPPQLVTVQGDTNAALAGALAANACKIPIAHIEAGLRSYDRDMPEEHNRVVTDHLADLCCAPTDTSRQNLIGEGIDPKRISVTGNTVVEAVKRFLPDSEARREILRAHGLEKDGYVLATFHRPENVDTPEKLERVLRALDSLPIQVILALHPRTVARVEAFDLTNLLADLQVTEPLDYQTFLALEADCALLVSDSGGIQEEASVLKRPVIVARNSTERPEVLGTFARLVRPGEDLTAAANEWLQDVGALHERLAQIATPYGDGTASERSVEPMKRLLG